MRELTYYVATSLDGRIAAPDGTWDAFLAEGDHMDVIVDEFADTLPGHVRTMLGIDSPARRFETALMGWNTYAPALDVGIDSPYPHLEQVVATRRHTVSCTDITITDDPVATVRSLRDTEGSGIWLVGGGTLAGELVDEIDHLVLKINPIVLGDGIPVLGGSSYADRPFSSTRVRSFESGVVIAEYSRRVGGVAR